MYEIDPLTGKQKTTTNKVSSTRGTGDIFAPLKPLGDVSKMTGGLIAGAAASPFMVPNVLNNYDYYGSSGIKTSTPQYGIKKGEVDWGTPAQPGSVATITPPKTTSGTAPATTNNLAPAGAFVPNWAETKTPPPPGSVAAEAWKWQDYETPEEKALRERASGYITDMNQVVDYDALYAQQLARQQSEIDSTNALYNDMLIQSRLNNAKTYERRANSTAAVAVNQGLVGSNVGEGMVRETESANMAEQAAAEAVINEQRQMQIAAIRKQIRQSAEAELKSNREARAKGAEATIENVKSRQSRRLDSAQKAIKAYLAAGVDVLSLDEKQRKELLGDIGLPDKELRDAIETLAAADKADKSSAELANLNTKSETEENLAQAKKAEADAKKAGWVAIGDGSMLYNTETGVTKENPKNFSPNTGSNAVNEDGSPSKNYDAKTIPADIKGTILVDVKNAESADELMAAYPNVNSDYVQELFDAFN